MADKSKQMQTQSTSAEGCPDHAERYCSDENGVNPLWFSWICFAS